MKNESTGVVIYKYVHRIAVHPSAAEMPLI